MTSFVIEIDGKTIHSKIKEKEEAKEIYDDAIAEGHGKLIKILLNIPKLNFKYLTFFSFFRSLFTRRKRG